ncbi:MAG: OsmC family protein [Bacteroidia bacterium]|nr:OsmC family protein [Bacteroidia bacterium]
METVSTIYLGDLRTRALHIKSGAEIITDAPVDNQGRGEAFSPTDLLATSLGSCMLTIIGIAAREHGFSIDGTEVKITKIMESQPRKVKEVVIEMNLPANNYTDMQKKIIELATRTCPVALSLHPDLKQTIMLNY